jgi:hypothetical protein
VLFRSRVFASGMVDKTVGLWGFNTENIAEVPLSLESGQTYYLRLSTKMGWSGAHVILERVEEPIGLALVRKFGLCPVEEENDHALKEMPVPTGKALLYILGHGGAWKMSVKVDGAQIGTVHSNHQFLYRVLDPGSHTVSQGKQQLTLEITGGEVAYVELSVNRDFRETELHQIQPVAGRTMLIPCRLGELSP